MLELCVGVENSFDILLADDMGEVKTVQDLLDRIGGSTNNSAQSGPDYNIEDYPLPKTRQHIRALKRYMALSRFFWKFEVSGLEHIPQDGNYILTPNHQSLFDPLWIWTAVSGKQAHLSKVCCLAAELFQKSSYRMAMFGGIPVERSGNTIPAMKRCAECLQDGYSVLIFPEGTRSRDGLMHDFKGGAAKLAIDAGVKIVPARIDGAWDIFPPHEKCPKIFNWKKLRRHTIKITFGAPISPEGKNVESLTEHLQNTVAQLGEAHTSGHVVQTQ